MNLQNLKITTKGDRALVELGYTNRLAGKVVARVEYMSEKECEEIGWYHSAPCIVFTDGSSISAMQDDEGNDAGAFSYSGGHDQKKDPAETFPVIAIRYLKTILKKTKDAKQQVPKG